MSKIYHKLYNVKSTIISYGPSLLIDEKSNILRKFNLKKNNFYLIIGRLIPDNNSDIIIKGYLKSNTKRKLLIVGDVPYVDKFSTNVKKYASNKIIFTGYIKDKNDLTSLYKNCFAYVHGHEYGGTNPTMVNALSLNNKIMALNTVFNIEMLKENEGILFDKTIASISKSFNIIDLDTSVKNNFDLSKFYCWDFVVKKYESLFYSI